MEMVGMAGASQGFARNSSVFLAPTHAGLAR
jgi:hypothetical protein